MPSCFAPLALLPTGWASHVRLTYDDNGALTEVTPSAPSGGAERLDGPVVPGMPNVHGHAFQRAMLGLSGGFSIGGDTFWSWRKTMYRFASSLDPDDVEAIATYLYIDLLKHGYTAIGEFHYLHHAPDGTPYSDRAELAHRMVQAAESTGIRQTLLPVLYTYSDFGGVDPLPEQQRFINSVDQLFTIILSLRRTYPNLRLGLAPHSLRAIVPGQLEEAATLLRLVDDTAPMHIHIAEQQQEVDGCLAWSGQRPVSWLLDHTPVNARWCLVHATHTTAKERDAIARSGAVVGLCPTTEADLGDGLFDVPAYVAEGGRLAIGSDSHVSVAPTEELRMMEYAQRLTQERRNVIRFDRAKTVARGLYDAALAGGAQALGQPVGQLAPGYQADFCVLRGDHPLLAGKTGDTILDTYLATDAQSLIRDVYVAGQRAVTDGHHDGEASAAQRYRVTLEKLLG